MIRFLTLYSNLVGKKCLTIIGTEGPYDRDRFLPRAPWDEREEPRAVALN